MSNKLGIFESVKFLNEGLFSFIAKKKREKNATRLSKEEFEKAKKDIHNLKSKLNSILKSLNPEITDDHEFEEKVAAGNSVYCASFDEISKKYDELYKSIDEDDYEESSEKIEIMCQKEEEKLASKLFKILNSFAKSNKFSIEKNSYGYNGYSGEYPFIRLSMYRNPDNYSIRIEILYKEMVIIE